MVRTILLLATLLVASCEDSQYNQPIRLTPHGDAVRANMAAQIINATPNQGVNNRTDGTVAQRGYKAYQDGEVEELQEATTQQATTAAGS